jgi:pilus assembly protein CpaC
MRKMVFLAVCMLASKGFCDDAKPLHSSAASFPKVESSEKSSKDNAPQRSATRLLDRQNATVLLKVSIIEVSVTKLRKLGMDFASLDAPGSVAANRTPPAKEVDLFGEASLERSGCRLLEADDKCLSILKQLVKDHLAEILAQPILVTQNGRPASFHCGGEIPVPVPQSAAATTIEWKRHGTQVDFVPVILEDDAIKMEIRARFSELEENHGVRIGGTYIPGLRATEMDTAVKIRTNQVAVLSGARRSRIVKTAAAAEDQQPKSTPSAAAGTKPETEEIEWFVLIKPEIVEPMK